jgi:hypothetical protein
MSNQCLLCLIVFLHLIPAVFWYRAMRRREAGCGRPATALRTRGGVTTMRETCRQRQELEGTIIYVLEGRRRRLPIILVLIPMRLAGLIGRHHPLTTLRTSSFCAKVHTHQFPTQLTYTKARPHSLRTATTPKRLTQSQVLLWRMAATTAVADTPTDQPTNGLHDRDTTPTR